MLNTHTHQARSQPSDNGGQRGGGRFPKISDFFQGLKIKSSQWLSRGNLYF